MRRADGVAHHVGAGGGGDQLGLCGEAADDGDFRQGEGRRAVEGAEDGVAGGGEEWAEEGGHGGGEEWRMGRAIFG